MAFWTIYSWFLVISVTSLASQEKQTQSASIPSIDEVLQKHIAARGGHENLKRITSLISRFSYREPDFFLPQATFALMRPYYKLVGDPEQQAGDYSEGYDGAAWEYFKDPGIVVRTVGPPSAAMRHHSWVDGPFVHYREKGISLTLEGIEKIGNRPAYSVRLRFPDGFEEQEYIDTVTYMWIASRKSAPVHAFGKDIASETRFSKFRSYESVLYPTVTEEVEIRTGKILSVAKMISMTINKPISAAAFGPPEFQRTPLQKFLEQLFLQRTDIQAVLWSYREFRRTHPEISTDVGIQVIGYQMLKMGDSTATSLEVLQENARDYPNSSDAAFGLGRAYRKSGNETNALLEFRRALSLNPENQRAKEALQEK